MEIRPDNHMLFMDVRDYYFLSQLIEDLRHEIKSEEIERLQGELVRRTGSEALRGTVSRDTLTTLLKQQSESFLAAKGIAYNKERYRDAELAARSSGVVYDLSPEYAAAVMLEAASIAPEAEEIKHELDKLRAGERIDQHIIQAILDNVDPREILRQDLFLTQDRYDSALRAGEILLKLLNKFNLD